MDETRDDGQRPPPNAPGREQGTKSGAAWREAKRLLNRGRFSRLRITRKGKPVIPDIPMAAVVAAEAASLYGAGLGRALLANFGAKLLFDFEVVNDADAQLVTARDALLAGDLRAARAALEHALSIDTEHPGAHLQLGVVCKLESDRVTARSHFVRALEIDPDSPVADEARGQIATLDGEEAVK